MSRQGVLITSDTKLKTSDIFVQLKGTITCCYSSLTKLYSSVVMSPYVGMSRGGVMCPPSQVSFVHDSWSDPLFDLM